MTAEQNTLTVMKTFAAVLFFTLAASLRVPAQGSEVPVYSHTGAAEEQLRAEAEKLRGAGGLLGDSKVSKQLNRKSCKLHLPPANTARLSSRELWATARAAHLRIGWYYLCNRCNNRHLNLAAGYAITSSGDVATCYHVVVPPKNIREGFLVVANDDGNILPVSEILAANEAKDVCILRVASTNLHPLPLKTDIYPGDRCVCFSDPLGERGYFSDGIVNRFLKSRPERIGTNSPPATSPAAETATRLNVTTDWAPGSSGAAVLDECGNAIGHVTSISTLGDHADRNPNKEARPTLITLHEAVSARNVLSLIRK